jgi:hypothetical protein
VVSAISLACAIGRPWASDTNPLRMFRPGSKGAQPASPYQPSLECGLADGRLLAQMRCMMSTMRDLNEQSVSFRYVYNMKCEHCGGVTPLSASTYYREQGHSARIKCKHCPTDIHYGPNALALRDAGDPVLNDQVALDTAWYHTSTHSRWPPSGQRMTPAGTALLRHGTSDDAADSVRERLENKALHVGTYEAAIESMLRKMRDEDMAGERFWLYRVELRRKVTIELGYRNETFEEVAQITQAELGDFGAIRYLNTWESPGSISLAVHPRSLAAVQGIPLPVGALQAAAPPSLLRRAERIRQRVNQIEAVRQDKPDQLEKLRQRQAALHGATLDREPTSEQYRLLEEICKLIRCEYLPGVSLTVRERFSDALSDWARAQEPPPGDVQFIERFAVMAALLTRPEDIQRALDAETPRPFPT